MSRSPAEFFVHPVVIDYVVSVGASFNGLQIWGTVHMADAQVAEIRDDATRIVERKSRVQLKAIGSRWNHRGELTHAWH
jgi:hypothetical protein